MNISGLLILISFFLFSCEKKELPVLQHQPGDLVDFQVAMETDYKNQIWFSLNDSRVAYTNLKSDWDITFETSATGFHVMLNGSKAMKAFKTKYTTLAEVTDTSGIGSTETGKADMPSGNMDSTAIGDWVTDNKVYVINRGYNEKGQHQGYYKLKLSSVDATQYTFEYSPIKNPKVVQGSIIKNSDYNFMAYSFSTNQTCMNIEPKQSEYDICFTQYTHYFNAEKMYYLVTGALTNTYKTRVIRLKDKTFADITIGDTLNRTFSTRRDMIGYDWKYYDLNGTGTYTTYPDICYIISDSRGYYYKLHFIDFLKAGVKGYPTFQFQRL